MSMHGPAFPVPGQVNLTPPFGGQGGFSQPGMSYKEWLFGMMMSQYFVSLSTRGHALGSILDAEAINGEIDAAAKLACICVSRSVDKATNLA